ncbi:MAG: DUF1499 domain-containing protein, partial [Chlorobiales bacterium]|nr:DUF1499 domain-containing protein [Chlorobiales bacterium]
MDILNDAMKALTDTVSGFWPQPSEKPGLENGKLRPCPGTPNCVCSENSDSPGRVEPVAYGKMEHEKAWTLLKKVVDEMGGAVQDEAENYLWTTFSVPLFGFVDDVEFRLEKTGNVIHVRSASRLGFSDLGVNRNRVDDIRRRFVA